MRKRTVLIGLVLIAAAGGGWYYYKNYYNQENWHLQSQQKDLFI